MTVTVLQLSDLHFTTDADRVLNGRNPDARLTAVLDAWTATGEHLDALLVTGDDADDGSAAAYERLAAALGRLDVPTMVIPGNHDDPDRLRAVFGTIAPIEIDGWRLVGVDTSRPGDIHGTVDAAAVATLLDSLDDRPTILAIHHPPVPPSTNAMFQLHGAEGLLDVLAARPHVRAVASGHLHQPFEVLTPDGLQLLGAPSTWTPIDHFGERYVVPGTCPTGARVLRLGDAGELTSSVFEV